MKARRSRTKRRRVGRREKSSSRSAKVRKIGNSTSKPREKKHEEGSGLDLLFGHILEYHIYIDNIERTRPQDQCRYQKAGPHAPPTAPYHTHRPSHRTHRPPHPPGNSYRVLTNIIVEPHERPHKLPISLHDDPDSGVDASVDEFCDERVERESRGGAGAERDERAEWVV